MKRLEYIESSGTQYIDTGYLFRNDTRIEMDCNITVNNVYIPSPFGVRVSTSGSSSNALFFSSIGANVYYSFGGGERVTNNVWVYNIRAQIVAQKNSVAITRGEGTVILSTNAPTTYGTLGLYLFAHNLNGAPWSSTLTTMRLYRCTISEGDTVIHDFLPVEDDNGVACLWDAIAQSYYRNAGTGNFTAGPEPAPPVDFNKKMFLAGLAAGRMLWRPPDVSRPVASIRVTTPPTKLRYADGEALDYAGMVVTAYDRDGIAIRTISPALLNKPAEADYSAAEQLVYSNADGTVLALYCEVTYQYASQGYVYPHSLGTRNGVQHTIQSTSPGVVLLTRWYWSDPIYGGVKNWGLLVSGSDRVNCAEIRNGSYSNNGTSSATAGHTTFQQVSWENYWVDLPVSTADPRNTTLADMAPGYGMQRLTVSYVNQQGVTLSDSFCVAVEP